MACFLVPDFLLLLKMGTMVSLRHARYVQMPAVQNRPKAYGLTILIYEKMVSCCSQLR